MNESKVMQFIEKFDELYAKNKGVIFQSFQEGSFTLSEQKEIFDGLKTKQKCQLYNIDIPNKACQIKKNMI